MSTHQNMQSKDLVGDNTAQKSKKPSARKEQKFNIEKSLLNQPMPKGIELLKNSSSFLPETNQKLDKDNNVRIEVDSNEKHVRKINTLSENSERYREKLSELLNEVAKLELPLEDHKKLLFESSRLIRKEAENLVPPIPVEITKAMKFPGNHYADPYEWLGEHYSAWLKHFNPALDRDYLFQHELRKLDEGLLESLRSQSRKLLRRYNLGIQDIISPKKMHTIAKLEMFNNEEKKEFFQLLHQERRHITPNS